MCLNSGGDGNGQLLILQLYFIGGMTDGILVIIMKYQKLITAYNI